ncbi:2,3-diaminopropionate biosynthesis protein SbnA [Nannocystis sp. RBIL2]|nr:2,3-diaminopropionate biosynthesis protein SbnA [Nannocystis sp. RBIL2]
MLVSRIRQLVRSVRETPIVQLSHPHLNLFAKLEYCNMSHSIKDRSALWILLRAIERGEIDPETTVVESSSGNFAVALAVYSRLLGLRFVPVVDPVISPLYEATLRCLCPRVEKVSEADDCGGYLKARLSVVQTLRRQLPRVFWPNQYQNTDAWMGHFDLTGKEIAEQLQRLHFLFVAVSTGGTLAGLSRRLKERFPGLTVVAVDVEGSVIFGGPPRRRTIPGIGSSIVPGLLKEALVDDVVIVTEEETIACCKRLLHEHHLFAGGSTGSVFAAIERRFAGHRGGRPDVLFLCADRGSAYFHNVYGDLWSAERRDA